MSNTPITISSLNRLRASVLGSNDGIISTASVVMGMVGAGANSQTIFIAGLAALVAGAFSMAVGEYVSVASQRDAEKAQIKAKDAEYVSPTQAAFASFVAFGIGGSIPLIAVTLARPSLQLGVTVGAVIIALLCTGYASATAGKASPLRAMLRILIGGMLAMAATYGVGTIFGTFV